MAILSVEELQKSGRFVPPAFVFCASFTVYLLTLCPTVYVGDSAEFITNAATLGINHPTGYPLYTVLGRLVVLLLPMVTPAFALNLLSAMAASGSVVGVYLIVQLLTSHQEVAAITALLFGFSHTLWARATTAEVYTLNAFCVAAALLFVLRWYYDGNPRHLLLTAYIVGLGLSQHVTGVLVASSIIMFVLLTRPRIVFDTRLVLLIAGFALVGLTTYLYLPIRSAAKPPLDWGNPGIIDKLISHMYPVGSKGIGAFFGSQDEGRISWIVTQALSREFWYFGGIAFFGIAVIARHWRVLALFVMIVVLNMTFALSRKLPLYADFDAYFIPTYLVMVIFAGLAIASFLKWLASRRKNLASPKLRYATSVFLFILPAACLLVNYHENDRSANYFGYEFGINVLSPLEKNAIIFTIGDEQTFLGWYFKYLERLRPDIAVVDVRLLGTSWGGANMFDRELHLPIRESGAPQNLGRQIINTFLGQRPIYFTNRLPWDFVLKEYDMVHIGMLIQILPKGTSLKYSASDFVFHPGSGKAFLDERCKLLVNFYPKEYLDNAQFWLDRKNNEAAQNELNGFFSLPYPKDKDDRATGYLLQSVLLGQHGQTREAMAFADSALVLNPVEWRAYEYRGNFCFAEGDSFQALMDWEKSLSLYPNNKNLERNIQVLSQFLRHPATTPLQSR